MNVIKIFNHLIIINYHRNRIYECVSANIKPGDTFHTVFYDLAHKSADYVKKLASFIIKAGSIPASNTDIEIKDAKLNKKLNEIFTSVQEDTSKKILNLLLSLAKLENIVFDEYKLVLMDDNLNLTQEMRDALIAQQGEINMARIKLNSLMKNE